MIKDMVTAQCDEIDVDDINLEKMLPVFNFFCGSFSNCSIEGCRLLNFDIVISTIEGMRWIRTGTSSTLAGELMELFGDVLQESVEPLRLGGDKEGVLTGID